MYDWNFPWQRKIGRPTKEDARRNTISTKLDGDRVYMLDRLCDEKSETRSEVIRDALDDLYDQYFPGDRK